MTATRRCLMSLVCALIVVGSLPADEKKPSVLEKERELKLRAHWLAFNSKGTELAACVGHTHKRDIKILDARTFKVLKTFIAAGTQAAFALDDKFLIVSGVFSSGIELIDRANGEAALLNYGDNYFVCQGGSNLLAYTKRNTIQVYDLAKKAILGRWKTDDPLSIPWLGGFSDKGVLLASFTKDRASGGELIVANHLLVWAPPFDKDPVIIQCDKQTSSLALSPDGEVAAIGSSKGEIAVWDLKNKKRSRTLRHKLRSAVNSVLFSPDGTLLASAAYTRRKIAANSTREVILWDLKTNRPRGAAEITHQERTVLAFTPDSKKLITSSRDGMTVWKVER